MKQHTSTLIVRQVERIEGYLTLPTFNPLSYRRLVSHLTDLCQPLADETFHKEIENLKSAIKEQHSHFMFIPTLQDPLLEDVEAAFSSCIHLLSRLDLL